ncbi:MAG TPA: type III pantothenate kinase [Levilinea sp.]|nr:type III pantothenate kinase [Levilinea sp.]
MLLVIDLGNTNLTLGLYQAGKLGPRWRLATDHERMPDEYGLQITGLLQYAGYAQVQLEGVCLSSVVPQLTDRLIWACQHYLNQTPLVVSCAVKTGLTILYDDPSAVGSDRLADAVAIRQRFTEPACVIDFGTATTFNAITRNGEYLGGAITAGIGIASAALTQHAARLPGVPLLPPPGVIGRNTIHAMQSGLVLGNVAMMEGMVARFRAELGDDMKVIATGGFSELIAQQTALIDLVAPWLTLDGLRLIWEMNQ